MRVAIAGKGGAGKTTISATLARLLAASRIPVVAIDADSNPNLAAALGVPRDVAVASLPPRLVSRRLDGPGLVEPVDAVIADHAVQAPGGVRLLSMGMPAHAGEGCLCAAHATVSALLGDLGTRPETVTLVDMEASPEHLSRGTARHVDLLLLVTEPYYRSLETVRRLAVLAGELPIPRVAVVANKVRSRADGQAVADFCARSGLLFATTIPWSDGVLDADLHGTPLVDGDPHNPAVTAISGLAALVRQPSDTVAQPIR